MCACACVEWLTKTFDSFNYPDSCRSMTEIGLSFCPEECKCITCLQQTSSAASSTAMTPSDGLPTSQLTATSMAAENPLQKLLMQLQRGQQPGMGPIVPPSGPLGVAVSGGAMPGMPAAGIPLDKPPEQQFDAIQSLMQQLTKMQPPTPEQVRDRKQRSFDCGCCTVK